MPLITSNCLITKVVIVLMNDQHSVLSDVIFKKSHRFNFISGFVLKIIQIIFANS